ncbi:uncharacterized protein LOC132734140 [Ruditapes philippinarum]|uniref:uncharacterized protein LOC132734140 n=1 Tax=Ruditapes philippinarum TaxID=129788 RepID=UPI00295B851B|nr:uncharacterized protein LOC132734140 [Ruditapes philippinarum]
MIKYAHVEPNKLETILEMLRNIIDCKFEKERSKKNEMSDSAVRQQLQEHYEDYRNQIKEVLLKKNKEELTPLQLAAKRQQFEIFEVVLQHEIYIPKHTNDSLFHHQKYDITEIETLALKDGVKGTDQEDFKTEHHEFVLRIRLR